MQRPLQVIFGATFGVAFVWLLISNNGDDAPVSATAEARTWPPLYEQGMLEKSTVVCLADADMDKLADFAFARDREAFTKFAYSRILIGACVMFDNPIKVYVQDSSVWRGRLCVRPVGQTECYWAPNKSVSKL
jgi:hypothetical protein